jgi:methyl-accepting chemotaxis protein
LERKLKKEEFPVKLSLKTKLIATVVVFVFFATIACTLPLLIFINKELEQNFTLQMEQGLMNFSLTMEDLKVESKKAALLLSNSAGLAEAVKSKNPAEIKRVLAPSLEASKLGFVTITDENLMVLARTHSDKIGDSVANQKNLQLAMQDNPTACIEPGSVVPFSIRAGALIRDAEGKVVGALSTGFEIVEDFAVVNDMKKLYGFEATIFRADERISTTLMDAAGKRMVGTKAAPDVAQKVLQEGKIHTGIVKIFDKDHLVAYKPFLGEDNTPIGMLFVGQDISVRLVDAQKNIALMVVAVAIAVILISIAIVFFLAGRATKPIYEMTEVAAKVCNNDLTRRVQVLNTGDELETLARGFNNMIEQLRDIVKRLEKDAAKVLASTRELNESATEVAAAAESVHTSIATVNQDAHTQKRIVDESNLVISRISENINTIDKVTTKAVADVKTAATLAVEGEQSMQSVINQMSKIEDTVNNSSEAIFKLGNSSKEISQIVDTISAISGQTNLLALNAAIEAARAGESGRGFAVVAEEVRKLAEQSQTAASQIAQLISQVQAETEKAVAAMTEGAKETKIGSQVVTTAGQMFNQIATSVEQTTVGVSDISHAMQILNADNEKMVGGMNSIEDATDKNITNTASVSNSSQEQLASLEEISAAATSLTELAQDLNAVVTSFKV